MTDVLSNEQVAALVEAARDGQIPEGHGEGARRTRRVREVDFSRPTKFPQEQLRRLERGHEAFCRTVSTQLSAELRVPVEFEVINVDQQTWTSALSELPYASLFAVVETSNATRVLLAAEQRPVMMMIERLLGGAREPRSVERELTEIEVALARRLFTTVVTQLSRTWDELMSTTLTFSVLETQQANIQLVSSSEPTLAITLEVRIETVSSTLTLLLPYRSIEASLERVASGQYGDAGDAGADEEAEEMVRSALRGIEVEVRAEIGSCEITVDEVLGLRPGDVLRLGSASAGGTVYADAVPIHRAKPGRSGNHRAVEILERIEER